MFNEIKRELQYNIPFKVYLSCRKIIATTIPSFTYFEKNADQIRTINRITCILLHTLSFKKK